MRAYFLGLFVGIASALFVLILPSEARTVSCYDLQFAVNHATPLTLVTVEGLPDLSEPAIVHVLENATDSEAVSRSMIIPDEGPTGEIIPTLVVPVHPGLTIAGGTVYLQVEYETTRCPPLPFTIDDMQPNPQVFSDLVDTFEEMLGAYAEGIGYTVDELATQSIDDAPLPHRPLIAASRLVVGANGQLSIREQFEREHLAPDVDDATWDLLTALVDHAPSIPVDMQPIPSPTGSSHLNDGRSPAVWSSEALASRTPVMLPPPTSSDAADAMSCSPSFFYEPSAQRLSELMMAQARAHTVVNSSANWMSDASMALLGLGSALAERAGAKPLASLYGGVAAKQFAFRKMADLFEGLYPSRLGDLTADYGPGLFYEDSPTTGSWSNAQVTAHSTGVNITRLALDTVWQHMGGRATSVLTGSRHTRGTELAEVLTEASEAFIETQDALLGTVIGEALGSAADSAEINFAACTFGPVDVSDEEWLIAEIQSDQIASMTSHTDYEVHYPGITQLMLRTRSMTFGPTEQAVVQYPIEIRPIEVRIRANGGTPRTTQTLSIVAEDIISLEAVVENARDETVAWALTPADPHHLSDLTRDVDIPNSSKVVQLVTSSNPEDFPITLTATSTASSGLRARPGAPRRYSSLVIQAEETFSCLSEFEIAMTELDQCSFVAHVDGTLPASGRRTSRHPISECVTGTIQSWRVNDHGIQHLELRGGFEDGNMRINLRFEDPREYTLETDDFGMGGSLMKAIEESVRSPMGRSSGTRMQPRMSEALRLEHGELTVYPLADMPSYYGGRFTAHLTPLSNARRLRGTDYDVHGMLMGGPACR